MAYGILVFGLFICTPKVSFILLKVTLNANALLTLSFYTRQTQRSAQLFRPCVSDVFDI